MRRAVVGLMLALTLARPAEAAVQIHALLAAGGATFVASPTSH